MNFFFLVATVADLLEYLNTQPQYQLRKPSIRTAKQPLYLQGAMAKQFEGNLEKTLTTFVSGPDDIVSVTDPSLAGVSLDFEIKFSD